MKKQYSLTLVCLMLLNSMAFSQTKMIAHKSHSGTASTFNWDADDNLGLGPTPMTLEEKRRERSIVDRIMQISDTSLVFFYTDTFAVIHGVRSPAHFTDTIHHYKHYFDEAVANYKRLYPHAKFILAKNDSDTKKQEIIPVFGTPQDPGNDSGLMLPAMLLSLFVLLLFAIIVSTNKQTLARFNTAT